MEDKKSYRIDEAALREKFLNYRVNFNPACLELLENEVAHVKTHTSLELPETKKVIRFVVIPLVLIGLGCTAFFTFSYVKNLPAKEPVKDSTVIAKPKPQPETKEPVKAEAPLIKDSIKNVVNRQDTIFPAAIPQKIKTPVKTPVQQKMLTSKKDTVSVNNVKPVQVDSAKKKNKADTTATPKNKDIPSKKKKKKHKNPLDATEDIRQSAPNSADDDVIVPNN
jgi:hypothetical protein